MKKLPLIGLTSYQISPPQIPGVKMSALMTHYTDAVSAAGGIPLILPISTNREQLDAIMDRLDGLVLVGGGDMHPKTYGQELIEDKSYGVDEARDEMELHLACNALERDMPLLTICRGFQVLNVALGGTLWQDVRDMMPNAIQHSWFGEQRPRNETPHEVAVTPGSQLAELLGTTQTPVNSIHHQGIKELGEGLIASAVAPDGLIEGYEIPGKRFAVGVQWHPEAIVHDVEGMQGLFDGHARAASGS